MKFPLEGKTMTMKKLPKIFAVRMYMESKSNKIKIGTKKSRSPTREGFRPDCRRVREIKLILIKSFIIIKQVMLIKVIFNNYIISSKCQFKTKKDNTSHPISSNQNLRD